MQPILVVAHPGHELRLFAWMERHRPLVAILTDGSGSAAPPRSAYSARLIEGCGATLLPHPAPRPDRAWYADILAGDAAPFLDAAAAIARHGSPGALVVADPVEGYNPMHDLAAAIADRVALLLQGQRASYPLMAPGSTAGAFRLDDATTARKHAAVAAYAPLAAEAEALLRADPACMASEAIRPDPFAWPEALPTLPDYERIGAARSAAGIYGETIGYAAHVRPIALRLRAP